MNTNLIISIEAPCMDVVNTGKLDTTISISKNNYTSDNINKEQLERINDKFIIDCTYGYLVDVNSEQVTIKI